MQPSNPPAGRATNVVAVAAALVLIVLIVAFGVGLRWTICSTIETAVKPPGADELPFTLESALLFHYADEYHKTGRIPQVDMRAQVPEGLHVRRDLSIGKEFLPAWLYNGLGVHKVSFQRFVRRFDAAWYCLGMVPLFLFVWGRTRSLVAASLAALLLTTAYTAVVRSTGLEFSRENFALPLIFAHFWLLDVGRRRKRLGPSVAAGIVLAIALATWDMTQLYLLLLVAYWAVRCLVRRAAAEQLVHLAPTVAFGFLAGLVVPYLWAHNFIVSYAMILGYGLIAWWAVCKTTTLSAPAAKMMFLVGLVALLILASGLPAAKRYEHFRDLLVAKLRYLNVKPEDPERLSFNARILWTPALHSATSTYLGRRPIRDFFPVFALGLIAAGCLTAAKLARRPIGEVSLLVVMMLAWLALYVLFVRMQVFLIFFLAAFIGIGIGAVQRLAKRRWPVVLAAPVVLLFLIADLGRSTAFGRSNDPADSSQLNKLRAAYGRDFAYAGAAELVRWLRENTPEDAVVLSDFMLQPTIFEYAERRIVLHPKFENPVMRDKVHEYLDRFYAPSEQTFHSFCRRNGAGYFVLSTGMFAEPQDKTGPQWLYSWPYIGAPAGDPINSAGTSWMLKDPRYCGYFRAVKEIAARGELLPLYRVFEVVTNDDIRAAEEHIAFSARFLDNYKQHGEAEDLKLAADALERAVELWPGCIEAYRHMVTVYALLGDDERALEAQRHWERLEAQQP